jgi:hypothetical protein
VRPKDVAPDTAVTVDGNLDRHDSSSSSRRAA